MKLFKGFTLIELMVVIAIIAFLSMISIPSLMRFLAKSKRTEAYVQLRSIAMAEKSYFAENGKYTANLQELGWKPEGAIQYTYGFGSGTEGQSSVMGSLKTPTSALKGGVTGDGFTACAAGDIDGDGKPDVICINQNSEVTIVEDDLA